MPNPADIFIDYRGTVRPLPTYAKGKKASDPYRGPAIAGEAGAELLINSDGASLMSQPTMIMTKPGDTIVPAAQTASILNRIDRKRFDATGELALQAGTMERLRDGRQRELVVVNSGGLSKADMRQVLGEALDARPVNQTIIDESGFSYYEKRKNNRTQYRQNRNSLK